MQTTLIPNTMPTPISTITLAEVKEFYPVTDSLNQAKIDDVMRHVKNVIFLEMFGFSITTKIFSGEIEDSADDAFMGFRNFTALNMAAYFANEVFTHTNAGLKAINQPNWSNPTKQEKNTSTMAINDAVTAQFIEAQKVLKLLDEKPANDYAPYSSFQIDKI